MNRWLSPVLWLALLAASLGVMVWTLAGINGGSPGMVRAAGTGQPPLDPVMVLGDNPIAIQPDPVRVDVVYDRADWERCAGWIAGPVGGEAEPGARTRTLHTSRLPFHPAGAPKWLVRDEQARVTRVMLAKQAFWHTWRGLEMAESAEGKPTEHRDQTLATLAESGVPLNATVEAVDGTFHVRDLLRTSQSEFHLDQDEISWTATAYVGYLPPQTTWQNRFGEQFSFDLVAEAIMRRPLTRESCGGTHLIMALTKIARVDRDLSILDSKVRGRLADYLRSKVSEAVDSQFDDGSWPMCWSPTGFAGRDGEFTPEATDTGAVTITGHLLEWFHFLPRELKPPARSVKAGTLWLRSKVQSSPQATVTKDFCPYTHALVSLELAASTPTR